MQSKASLGILHSLELSRSPLSPIPKSFIRTLALQGLPVPLGTAWTVSPDWLGQPHCRNREHDPEGRSLPADPSRVCLSLLCRTFVSRLLPTPSLSPQFLRHSFGSKTPGSGAANHRKCNFNFCSLGMESTSATTTGRAGNQGLLGRNYINSRKIGVLPSRLSL